VRLVLSITLVLVAFFTCYGENIYFSLWLPEPGRAIYLTVRSQHPFNFDQEKAFGSKRNIAIAQYTPLYTYMPERTESTKKKMRELIQRASALQPQGQKDWTEFEKLLRKEFGVAIGAEAAARLLQYTNLKNLLEAVLAIEETILQGRIVEDPKPLQGKKSVEVLFPKHLGTVAYPAEEVVTLEQARGTLQNKISQVFWQVDRSILDPIVQLVLANMVPNLKYDHVENDRRIEEIIRRYPSMTVPYAPGEVIVPSGKSSMKRTCSSSPPIRRWRRRSGTGAHPGFCSPSSS
jgi:membrane-associated HD superfamily phosphohydrolase